MNRNDSAVPGVPAAAWTVFMLVRNVVQKLFDCVAAPATFAERTCSVLPVSMVLTFANLVSAGQVCSAVKAGVSEPAPEAGVRWRPPRVIPEGNGLGRAAMATEGASVVTPISPSTAAATKASLVRK